MIPSGREEKPETQITPHVSHCGRWEKVKDLVSLEKFQKISENTSLRDHASGFRGLFPGFVSRIIDDFMLISCVFIILLNIADNFVNTHGECTSQHVFSKKNKEVYV